MKQARLVGVGLVTAALAGAFLGGVGGQQIHRNRFEGSAPAWIRGPADAPFSELVHDVTDTTAHTGQFCEHLQISSEPGSHIDYYYPTGRAPVTDELSARLWVKANRPGIQLLARLVLPREHNPHNLQEPLTTVLHGDVYHTVSRWELLELPRPTKLARQQQQQMRLELHREVDFTDAYIDRLILNLYAGPGLAEVWIDDLEIGPVEDQPPLQPTNSTAGPVKLIAPPQAAGRGALVEMDHGQLLVNGKRFFFRGIRHSDTPLKALRDAGFNTVWFDAATSPAHMEEAIRWGFWLVPALPVADNDPRLASADSLHQEISRFLERDAVLFWDVGGGLTTEQVPLISQTVGFLRAADPQRPVAADAWDGLPPYSLTLDLLGVHRWPLMTGLELAQYRLWLKQRRLLARSGTFLWTWVQTHLPDWYANLVYERPSIAGFDEPVGPQPEQIRLLTYTALAAGCRGLGFWSDRFLADSHQGRDRLLMLALLNQELRLLEPLLVTADDPNRDEASWLETSNPEVKAAVLHTKYGLLVLPIWLAQGAQYVPKQSATPGLAFTVPQVPLGTQAWEVSPGEVRSLKQNRVVGGTQITVPEFGLTAAILFTADNGPNGLVARFQDQCRQTSRVAAQWQHDLAEEEIRKVALVEEQLEAAGHTVPQGQKLLDNARARVKASAEFWNRGEYRDAYTEGERALRPLRILMRAQWEAAIKDLDEPVASPYAVSFYTLPRQWRFMELVRQGRPGPNLLPHGDFEAMPKGAPDAWQPQVANLDEVNLEARLVAIDPEEGRQCLMLRITPKHPENPPGALERTFLAVNSPLVRLTPGALVRVSGWVKVPEPIKASADGALLYDSAAGEPLAVRLVNVTRPTPRGEQKANPAAHDVLKPDPTPPAKTASADEANGKPKVPPKPTPPAAGKWQQFTLYRRVPASGTIGVTLALTGIGTVYFDDVRIEPLLGDKGPVRPAQRQGPERAKRK